MDHFIVKQQSRKTLLTFIELNPPSTSSSKKAGFDDTHLTSHTQKRSRSSRSKNVYAKQENIDECKREYEGHGKHYCRMSKRGKN